MEIFAFLVIHWYGSLFFQTFFHHRYAAHRMFTMNKFWEGVFSIGAFIFQGASHLSPSVYGMLHRQHHAYADTEKDPHSPKYDGNLIKMMLKTRDGYNDIFHGRVQLEDRFTRDLPGWFAFDKFANKKLTRAAWGIVYIAFYYFFATEWWMWMFLPIHFTMSAFHGAIINWFAHKIGYVNFKVSDTSKNLLPFDFLMLGESYHNNHHRHGWRANFGGFRWHEIDPVYIFIWIFDKVGIIKLRKKEAAMALN